MGNARAGHVSPPIPKSVNLRNLLWKIFVGPRTLSRDLGTGMLVLFALLLVVVGALTFVYEITGERNRRDEFARDMSETLTRLITRPLAENDEGRLAEIAWAHLHSDHIVGINITAGERLFRYRTPGTNPAAVIVVRKMFRLPDRSPAHLEVTFRAETTHEMRWRFLLYGLFVGLVVFLVAVPATTYLMRRLLRRPLGRVLEGVEHYARGDYNFRLKPGRQRDMGALIRGVNDMARNVQRREIELSNSEARYRSLVDSARHMTFSMNPQGIILHMNRAVRNLLGFREEDVIGSPLIHFLYASGEYTDLIRRELFRQKFAELLEQKGNVRFKVEFRTAQQEPRELEVSLEFVDVHGGAEEATLLGRAYAIPEDSLAKYLVSEVRSYEIGNFLTVAEQLTSRVTSGLEQYCNADDAATIRMGLREMLVNAIEHGNLNISFDEKTEATRGDDYFGFLASRQKDPRFRDRKVLLRYSLNPDRVRVLIRDQGEGFDHEKHRDSSPGGDLYHGRGILLARSIFDLVQYNESGNIVLLVKRFRKKSNG